MLLQIHIFLQKCVSKCCFRFEIVISKVILTLECLFQELFSGTCIPSMEGPLYVKSDSKKGWKKHHCILRASGLYYLPKDKVKTSYKDLICLATFDVNQVRVSYMTSSDTAIC